MHTIYSDIQAALQKGERVAIATVVKTAGAAPCGVGSKLLIRADSSLVGSLAGPVTDARIATEGLNALTEGRSYLWQIHLDADQGEAVGSCGATLQIFFEILRPEPRLIIAGAGYVAQSLARLATQLGFRVIVVDERRDLADPKSFTSNVQLLFGSIPETIHNLKADESSWIVIVTRGHQLDKESLQAALASHATYIGMIGSPGKVKRIFKELSEAGIPTERLAQVHAPIGLDLGAETPDEIALSIAAEIVMLRHQASGAPLYTRHALLADK
ncbi:XdhC family protein [Tengunoibacter tsumagoiensis]|uniref:Dehydrogenase n=1 Tax=Tengunoibacter tsumagoiensis TaxID=2014871 RepID=A0A401ZWE1_9CHLR|nr:XdhC/CoxI family protein [Tengunoibacter tsumagoiensis]GCE11126.1 dehydrogenase [Tengunoibacter tsumagoiensis]